LRFLNNSNMAMINQWNGLKSIEDKTMGIV